MQTPLQLVWPAGHPAPHSASWHRPLFGQTRPHTPHEFESVDRLTHWPLQRVSPAAQPVATPGTHRCCTQE